MNDPNFVTVAKKVPVGVICLISALYYYHLTVQIPKWIDIAVPQKYKTPALDNPPVRFHWLSDSVFYSALKHMILMELKFEYILQKKQLWIAFGCEKK